MMDSLRSAANHIVLKIIFALIILSFIFTGVSGYMFGNSQRTAAEVNGEGIPLERFERGVQEERANVVRRMGQQNADQLLSDPQELANLRQNVLRTLIDQELVNQYVQTLKLGANDEQVKDYIRSLPFFRSEQGFDNNLYRNYLMSQGISSDQFASMARNDVIMQQLNSAYVQTDFVLPSEIDSFIKYAFQQRKIRLATIDVAALKAEQTVTEQELEEFYQKNKDYFEIPERIKVEYLMIDAVSLPNVEPVTEQEIETYYEQNKAQYVQPARYGLNAIKLKTEDDAKAVIDELNNGADFSALAKEKSIDAGLRYTGGALGLIDEHALTKEMKEANLTEKGQVSQPIAVDGGYLVFQLYDFRKGGERTLDEIKDRVRQAAQLEKDKLAFYQLQQKVGDAIHNSPFSLKDAEDVSGLQAVETDWFTRDDIPKELNLPQLQEMLFDGSLFAQAGAQATNSNLLQVDGDRAFVVRVTDHNPMSYKTLDEVRDAVTDSVKQQKAFESAMAKANAIVADLKSGKSEADALKESGLTFGEEQTVERQNSPAAKIFELAKPEEGKATYDVDGTLDGNIVIIALDAIVEGEVPTEGDIEKLYSEQILNLKETANMESLILSLRQQAKIQIDDNV